VFTRSSKRGTFLDQFNPEEIFNSGEASMEIFSGDDAKTWVRLAIDLTRYKSASDYLLTNVEGPTGLAKCPFSLQFVATTKS
jgi:hypothetical protein